MSLYNKLYINIGPNPNIFLATPLTSTINYTQNKLQGPGVRTWTQTWDIVFFTCKICESGPYILQVAVTIMYQLDKLFFLRIEFCKAVSAGGWWSGEIMVCMTWWIDILFLTSSFRRTIIDHKYCIYACMPLSDRFVLIIVIT